MYTLRTDFNASLRIQEHIVRLDITVNDALIMQMAKTFASLYSRCVSRLSKNK